MSAASCVDHGAPADYEVGTVADDGDHLKVRRRIPVSKIDINPAYTPWYSGHAPKNDIAILELGMELMQPFSTISGQRSSDPKFGTLALVATIDFRSEPGTLLQGSVVTWNNIACAAGLQANEAEEIICAGSEHGRTGVCPGTGSAGGPLAVFSSEGIKYQVGFVSAAVCGTQGAYGIYTRISSYADWIKQVAPDARSEPAPER